MPKRTTAIKGTSKSGRVDVRVQGQEQSTKQRKHIHRYVLIANMTLICAKPCCPSLLKIVKKNARPILQEAVGHVHIVIG